MTDEELPPGSIELQTMQSTMHDMRLRMALLQAEVDKNVEHLIVQISANSSAEAAELRSTYDQSWFAKSLLSAEAKSVLAKRLIDAVARYPIVETDLWQSIVRGRAR